MATFLGILLVLGLITLLGTLAVGLVSMANGKEFNKKHGNTLMRLRVATQFFCLVVFVLLVLVLR